MKKRLMAIFAVLALGTSMFTGCGSSTKEVAETSTTPQSPSSTTEAQEQTETTE